MIAGGHADTAFRWLYSIYRIAQEKRDSNLGRECSDRIKKIKLPFQSAPYDDKGAADPQNCRPTKRVFTDKPKLFKETFTLKLKTVGETTEMINNRLAVVRIILIDGKYIAADTGKSQWAQLFKKTTTHEKIIWTGEKGHLIYLFKNLKPYIINPQNHRLWETVAAHFIWQYTYKNGKIVTEDFDHKKLSEGKAKQTKELDNVISWFMPEKNPNYHPREGMDPDSQKEEKEQNDAERKYDALSNGLYSDTSVTNL